MYLNCLEEVKKITKDLVKVPSIVKTSGEADCARAIYLFHKSNDYFKKNPEYLVLQRTLNDAYERYNVISMVKGTKGDSNKTI